MSVYGQPPHSFRLFLRSACVLTSPHPHSLLDFCSRFLITWIQNDYAMDGLNMANWFAFIVLLIAKLPIVHRVRFFGINSD